jgi:hypothetical protein
MLATACEVRLPTHSGDRTHYSKIEQRDYSVVVPCSVYANQSVWNQAENHNPPLSVVDAIDLAKAAALDFIPEMANLEPEDVNLIPCHGTDSWYYVVEFSDMIREVQILAPGESIPSFNFVQIGVLMDGTVLKPEPTPESTLYEN